MADKPKRKRGRTNTYDTIIEPRMDEICEWARAGSTNAEIASALGIARSTFLAHVRENPSFSDSLKEARLTGVPNVKLALYRRATGFEYEEKKTYIKKDEDGNVQQYTEITKKTALPDVGAIQTFLRNNTEDFRDKDKTTYDFKQMEIELKKEMMENQLF